MNYEQIFKKFLSRKLAANLGGIIVVYGLVPYLPVNYQDTAATVITVISIAYMIVQGVIDGIEKYRANGFSKDEVIQLIEDLNIGAQTIVKQIPDGIFAQPTVDWKAGYVTGDILKSSDDTYIATLATPDGTKNDKYYKYVLNNSTPVIAGKPIEGPMLQKLCGKKVSILNPDFDELLAESTENPKLISVAIEILDCEPNKDIITESTKYETAPVTTPLQVPPLEAIQSPTKLIK